MTTELSHHESVKYLRDSAIRAHLDGQGAKVRQLAAIALRKGANRGVIPVVNLKDLAWAFFLIIYWMLEEEDYSIVLDGAWESFNKKHHQENNTKDNIDAAWHAIIRFLMDVLMPNENEWDADIKALEKIPQSFFAMEKDQYANEIRCMSLPFVIDFVHYIGPDKKDSLTNKLVWRYLCERWEYLSATEKNADLGKSLETNRIRIEKQHTCLFQPGIFPYHAENAIEKFWDAFYNLDIDEMKKVLPELTKMVHDDEGKFYPVQSLINMTRFYIGWDSDQFPGVYRIQRLYMENPQWLFSRLRRMNFSEVLNNAYFEIEQGKAVGDKSVQIWRWPLVSEITALKNWDLGSYLNSITMQSEAWLYLGLFPADNNILPPSDSDADHLQSGIFQAVKGFRLQDKKSRHFSDVRRAFLNLELNEKSNTRIYNLIESIIKSLRPLEMRSAVNLFSIMGDAITKNQWEDVFKISIESFSKKNAGIDLTMLNWWEDGFKWVNFDKAVWDIVDQPLTNFFHNPAFWKVSNAMLTEALIKAPHDIAHKWANTIAESRIKNDLSQYGMPIVFNASLRRAELKEYALQVLDFLKDDPDLADQMAYDRALLLAAGENMQSVSKTPEGKKSRKALVEKLLQYAEAVAARRTTPPIRIGGLPFEWRPFNRISWEKLSLQEWNCIDQGIKSAIKSQYCSEGDFISLILIWSIIGSQQGKNKIDEAGRWLIDLCQNFQTKKGHIPGTSGPFSRMSFTSDLKDSSQFVITQALSHFIHKVAPSICNKMLSWIQDEIPETEEANLPTLWGMLLAVYIIGTPAQSDWALNALKAIYARTATDFRSLAKLTEKAFDVLITPHGKKKDKRLIEILALKNDINSVLSTTDKVIEKLVHAPYPDGRKAAAMVLNLFAEMGLMNEQRNKWIERLKNDPRARVFSVFKA